MKRISNDELLNSLYSTHSNDIMYKNNKKYLQLFQSYHDLVSNISNEDLRNRILYSHIRIEELLFNYISCTSRSFYKFGFNDLKNLLFENRDI